MPVNMWILWGRFQWSKAPVQSTCFYTTRYRRMLPSRRHITERLVVLPRTPARCIFCIAGRCPANFSMWHDDDSSKQDDRTLQQPLRQLRSHKNRVIRWGWVTSVSVPGFSARCSTPSPQSRIPRPDSLVAGSRLQHLAPNLDPRFQNKVPNPGISPQVQIPVPAAPTFTSAAVAAKASCCKKPRKRFDHPTHT